MIVRFARRLMALNGAVGPTSAGHLARAAEALGKLPYPDAAAREPAAALLGELAAWPNDPNVRSAAVTALGTFDGAGVLDLLAARLDQEPEVHVRKAVAGAIGQQALSFDDERRPRAVALLVPFLFTTTEAEVALRRRSQQRLEELAQGPSFAGLELIVDTLGKATEERAARQAALAFLLLLPPLDAVPADRRERHVRLLERRAAAQLEAGEAAAALSDYDVVGVVRG